MMPILITFLVLLAFCCPAVGAPAPVIAETAQRVEALIRELPARSKIRLNQQECGLERHDGREAEAERLQGEIDKAANIAKELRGLLQPGTSIFSYPGLLAGGEVSFHAGGVDPFAEQGRGGAKAFRGYPLDIGVPLVSHEEFRVLFDELGVIQEIGFVPNKR
jgi:hypothetical protein